MGRKPTKQEYNEGIGNSLAVLLARMRTDGIPFHPKPASKMVCIVTKHAITKQPIIVKTNRYNTRVCVIQGPRPPGYEREANVDIGNDDEDSDYVPSNDDASEDETMDTEADAAIWLEDVKHPSSSLRFRGHR